MEYDMQAKVYKQSHRVIMYGDPSGKIRLVRRSDNFSCALDLSEAADMMDMDTQFDIVAFSYLQGAEVDRVKYSQTYQSRRK